MRRVSLQPAYVLHRRPYRETSFLVDLLTLDHGRMTVVASGVRKIKSATQGILQPFIPLMVSWTGKGELMSLTGVEAASSVTRLAADCLVAGLYLNELMMALLQKWDVHTGIFHAYADTLATLASGVLEEKTLRRFELQLLDELGYGVLPKKSSEKQAAFIPDKFYRFIQEQGFVLSDLGDQSQTQLNVFSGRHLLQMTNDEWDDAESLLSAKRLMRFILTPLLGSRPIYSRQLFLQSEGKPSESN